MTKSKPASTPINRAIRREVAGSHNAAEAVSDLPSAIPEASPAYTARQNGREFVRAAGAELLRRCDPTYVAPVLP